MSLLVGVYHGLGKEKEAVEAERLALKLAERHIESHPDDARAYYLGAGMLARLGEKERSYQWAQ